MKAPKGWIVASELSDRLKNDPDHQAMVRQREAERQAAAARSRTDQAPIIEELRNTKINIEMISSQNLNEQLNPDAVDILVRHLKRPYLEATKEAIARALGTPLARKHWQAILSEYKATSAEKIRSDNIGSGYKEGLACTLAKLVSKNTLDEYIELVRDRSHGTSRILLLTALRRSRDARAKKALEDLADDPDLKKQIAIWNKKKIDQK